MLLYFGFALDDEPWHAQQAPQEGIFYVGPQGLLNVLEAHLGLSGAQPLDEYLRIEQYRQVLKQYLIEHPQAFFAASFEADPLATASALLQHRDDLLLAGFDFVSGAPFPPRIATLADMERQWRSQAQTDAPGFADRLDAVLKVLPRRRHPVQEIRMVEPLDILPPYWKRLFGALSTNGVQITTLPPLPAHDTDTDLAVFQRALRGEEHIQGKVLRGDGSLLLMRGRRDTDLAAWAAGMLRYNPHFRPVCLIAHKGRVFDNALLQEGLPSLGLLSASQARPTLQVLKLAPVFLWNPVDPFKVMEFVSLAVKPLDDGLAAAIAESMAQTPGLLGDGWRAAVARYLEEMEQRAASDASISPTQIRKQYRFWFERRRYDSFQQAPKADAIEVYRYIEQWAQECLKGNNAQTTALALLKEQANRIVELLQALPETHLSYLELERIVRTIYQPGPLQLNPREQGHLSYITQPGALIHPADEVLWWAFIQKEPDHFFSRWYRSELAWMHTQRLEVDTPTLQNQCLLWQRRRPVLAARRRLVLLLPQTVDGEEVPPHPLFGDLSTAFANLERITFHIDTQEGKAHWMPYFKLPELTSLEPQYLGRPRPFLYVRPHRRLAGRDEETFTSLETLLYYPHQWVFRHKIKLVRSSILSLVKDDALMGNLAHRFFERIFQQDFSQWTKIHLEQWIDQEAESLLAREGAVLLLYGREPERISFLNRVKHAAWSLMYSLKTNGWQVLATEQPLKGALDNTTLHGRADMVLQRGDELAVLDLKWSGIGYREDSIRNEADLQLALYSRLAMQNNNWAHTAFYIMEKARLLARNNEAFREIAPLAPGSNHAEVHQRIFDRILRTYRWRLSQLQQGTIEVRCEYTQQELEDTYAGQLLDLLEMKKDDARYDDYRVLINLVE